VYQVGINKGIILRCTVYQISRLGKLLVCETVLTNSADIIFVYWSMITMWCHMCRNQFSSFGWNDKLTYFSSGERSGGCWQPRRARQ